MASDELVWQIINQQMCSFKLKTSKEQTFCRNEYNVTGLCLRQACPLANSRYATVRADPANPQQLYLYTKTIERAHLPSKMWEKQKLSTSYAKALEQIDSELAYWPKYLIHKCKQRLTRLTQVALRMKRLAKEETRLGERVVPKMAPKIRRREEVRERKAERAARVDRAIERELLERLRSGAYGENPLNVDADMWKKVRDLALNKDKQMEDVDEELEDEDENELEEEYENELEGDVEYVSDIDGESDEDDVADMEDYEQMGAGSSDDEEDSGDEAADTDDDEDARLRAKLGRVKRKAGAQLPPPSKRRPLKRISGSRSKGPLKEIEYEMESDMRRQT